MNDSYCSLAWVGLTTDPDGTVRPCCVNSDKILKDDGTPYNIGLDSLDAVYNSTFYQKLRKDMLEGIKVNSCEVCYNNEKYGRESRRLINNETFKEKNNSTTIPDIKIKYLDLRLGNQCNLKCRMCSPMNSSMIEEELQENPIPTLDKFYLKSNIKIKDWYNTETFYNNLYPHFKNLITLYMTGGEPTLIKNNYEIMQRLIELGTNKTCTLIINTNMTNTNPKFYDLLKQFKNVIVQMSIDAIGDLSYYIRYPTNFNIVDKTIQDMLNLENVTLRATPVIQILNLNKLVELFDYLENFNKKYKKQVIDIRPNFLFMPDYNNISYLPKQYKVECYRKLYIWLIKDCRYQSIQFQNTMNALKSKCFEDKLDIKKLKDFLEFNRTLDKIRNTDLELYNKELYDVIVSNIL